MSEKNRKVVGNRSLEPVIKVKRNSAKLSKDDQTQGKWRGTETSRDRRG